MGATRQPQRSLADYGYRYVQIEVDERCNMACTFCPQPLRRRSGASLSRQEVCALLDQLAGDAGLEHVAFHQFNEPLLFPPLWDCLAHARQVGLKTVLFTNGVLLTRGNLSRLETCPPDVLRISLQTVRESGYHAARTTAISFSRYLQRIAGALARLLESPRGPAQVRLDVAYARPPEGLLANARHRLGVTEPGDPSLPPETPQTLLGPLDDFLKLVAGRSASFVYDRQRLERNLLELQRCAQQDTCQVYQLDSRIGITLVPFFNGRRMLAYHPVRLGHCDTNILGILATGEVVLCCLDWGGFTSVGNIRNRELVDLLDGAGPILARLRRGGLLPFHACRHCRGCPTWSGARLREAAFLLRRLASHSF